MDWLSPALVLLSFAVAAAVGWWRLRRDGSYPWIGVSGAMLCGFLLLHKVHSPQYTLWLLPFFVLLAVPWRWVIGYLVADVVMGIGIFRWFYALNSGGGYGIYDGFAAQAVAIGVWGRAALLVVLFVAFLTLPDRRSAETAAERTGPADAVGPAEPVGSAVGRD